MKLRFSHQTEKKTQEQKVLIKGKWANGFKAHRVHTGSSACVHPLQTFGHPRRNILYKAGSPQAVWIGLDLRFPVGRKVLWAMRHPHRLLPLTWSDCLQEGRDGSFSLTKHQGRYQLVLIVAFFVLWPEPELNPPQNWTQATGNSFQCFLSCARFNAAAWRSVLVLPRHGHQVLYLHQPLYFSWVPAGLWEETFTGQTYKSPILSCI